MHDEEVLPLIVEEELGAEDHTGSIGDRRHGHREADGREPHRRPGVSDVQWRHDGRARADLCFRGHEASEKGIGILPRQRRTTGTEVAPARTSSRRRICLAVSLPVGELHRLTTGRQKLQENRLASRCTSGAHGSSRFRSPRGARSRPAPDSWYLQLLRRPVPQMPVHRAVPDVLDSRELESAVVPSSIADMVDASLRRTLEILTEVARREGIDLEDITKDEAVTAIEDDAERHMQDPLVACARRLPSWRGASRKRWHPSSRRAATRPSRRGRHHRMVLDVDQREDPPCHLRAAGSVGGARRRADGSQRVGQGRPARHRGISRGMERVDGSGQSDGRRRPGASGQDAGLAGSRCAGAVSSRHGVRPAWIRRTQETRNGN